MKQRLQGMVFGIVLAVLVMAGSLTVFAAVRTETLTVTFRDIQLRVNGELVVPMDARGNVVEPFMISGTTYVPVRAVAEALGMEVIWDSETSTVYIGERNVTLTGTWYAWGAQEYVFNADGTGIWWNGQPLIWYAADGILRYCTTPELCMTLENCEWLWEWYYTVNGNRMHLINIEDPSWTMDLIHMGPPQATPPPTAVPTTPVPTTPAPTTPPPTTPAPTTPAPTTPPALTPEGASIDLDLVGIWWFEGYGYDVFNSDGTSECCGRSSIWGVVDDILFVCIHPDFCRTLDNCFMLSIWRYSIEGDVLTFISPFNVAIALQSVRVDYMSVPATSPVTDPPTTNALVLPEEFIGAWMFAEDSYVIFNADGTGRDYMVDILWGVTDNVLLICTTPAGCRTLNTCWLPLELYFVFDGDYLIYKNRLDPSIYMRLIRVDYMPEATSPSTPEGVSLTNELIGTWRWQVTGTVWYILNADGTGIMNGVNILWGTYNGVLFVCATPDSCGTIEACGTSSKWYYEFINGQLRLTSRITSAIYFYYTRG